MSRRKLLLADDSITIQKVVNLTFADEGIDVVTVGDGDAALAQLSSETPDIVLADVNMPGPTGYEICERLRANDSTRTVPVILLVGSFEPFDESEASRVGANAYLTKPFQSIKQLIAQVNDLMDAARPAAAQGETAAEPGAPAEPETESEVAEPVTEGSPIASESAADESTNVQASEARHFDDLGYETAAPVEASQISAPAPDDIDSLYEKSISGEEGLSDVGIDDDMIETSYTAPEPKEEVAAFVSESGGEEAPVTPVIEEPPAFEGDSESPVATAEAETGFRSGYDQRFPEDPSKFENTIAYEDWKPADMRPDEQPAAPEVTAEAPNQGSLETTPLNEPGPQPVEAVPQSPGVGDDTIRMEKRFDTTGSSSLKFDDVDLLDLSPSAERPVEITSPVNAVEQGSSKQVVTISPELIEMIAQRVVEKLSEKY